MRVGGSVRVTDGVGDGETGGGGFVGGPGARARVKRNFSFRYKHG